MEFRKYNFDKLIRSKLPARMESEGVMINRTKLQDEDFAHQLKMKLLEEAEEVVEASSRQRIVEELADVMEVIKAIAKTYEISEEEMEAERLKKLETNGSFEKENYINFIKVAESNKLVIEYLANKDRPYKFEKN